MRHRKLSPPARGMVLTIALLGLLSPASAQDSTQTPDPSKNKIMADKILVSKIFDWYKQDFSQNGTVLDFLNKYSSIKIQPTATISFLNYDWSLNE